MENEKNLRYRVGPQFLKSSTAKLLDSTENINTNVIREVHCRVQMELCERSYTASRYRHVTKKS